MEREKLIATVTAAQNGDSDALNTLFNAFYNDVYYFALKTVKDDDLACDITQETFVEIINTIGGLQEPAAFVKWMKQITYHQCTRYFKKKKDVLVEEDEEGNTIFDTLKEDKTEFIPDEALDQQDFRDTILAMLDDLSEEQRSATLLYYYDELSVKQIAEIQNVTEGTVKSRLNYARKSIKNSVETYEKKNGVKLHCAGVLPLLLWLLSQTGKDTMPTAAAQAVAGGVTTATGVTVAASVGGAGVAAATATTVAATSGVGIAAKIAALPVVVKVIASVVAGLLVLGGIGMAVLPEKDPVATDSVVTTSLSDAQESTTDQTEQTESTSIQPGATYYYVEEGYIYTKADGTVLSAGDRMPEKPSIGDTYANDVYTYRYASYLEPVFDNSGNMSGANWHVHALDFWGLSVSNTTLNEYPELKDSICGSPLRRMDYAFYNCTAMTIAPAIPETVTVLTGTYDGCTSLAVAPVIPGGVIAMGYTFQNCTSLSAGPVIPTGINNLFGTFYGCISLTVAPVIPDTVTSMSLTFSGCSALTHAPDLPKGLTSLSGAFRNCTSLVTAPIIPESVTDMTDAFSGCTSLTGIIEINGIQKACEFCEYYADDVFDCRYCDNNGVTCENCYMCSTILGCFEETVQPITLVGASPCLAELAATGNNGNVKLKADIVYSQADVANSIQISESWINNTPEQGEATRIVRIYVISAAANPICRIRSVEVVSASLNGAACQFYQSSTKENAQALLEKQGAASVWETEVFNVNQIICSLAAGEEPVNFEVILRFVLEDGQTLDLRFIEDRLQYGTLGILAEYDPEDFQ